MTMDKFTLRRYVLFLISLFVNSFGISLITRALLGTSPVTSITYVLSMFTQLSMGQWTIIVNLLFVVIELAMMSKADVKADLRAYLLQIPITFCFGWFIDMSMFILQWVQPTSYLSNLVYLTIGCMVLASAITLEVKANIALLAGEYIVRTISRRFKWDFGYTKLGFDITLVILSAVTSIIFMSSIRGVREGTLVAALTVGPIVHFLTPFCRVLDKWIGYDRATATDAAAPHVANPVITIAREYGSGGHLLGERLAEKLGIKLYDRELIKMAAGLSGMDEQYIKQNEQSIPSFWLKCIMSEKGPKHAGNSLSSDDILFVAQSKVIEEAANKGPCVIIGRCADFVLKDNPKVIKVFCYTDPADAHRRSIEEYGLSEAEADNEIKSVNRRRKAHYEYYTGEKWGDPHRYDFMVNTKAMSIETACNIITEAYKKAQAS